MPVVPHEHAGPKRTGLLLAVVLTTVGCGASTHPPPNGSSRGDGAAILSVMNDARAALLDGDAGKVCALLTGHGRDRVMAFRVNLDDGGQIAATDPRLPQTCMAMVDRLFTDGKRPDSGSHWLRQLRAARITVVDVASDRATAALKVREPYGPLVTFQLVRTESGWKIDDSDGVPSGR